MQLLFDSYGYSRTAAQMWKINPGVADGCKHSLAAWPFNVKVKCKIVLKWNCLIIDKTTLNARNLLALLVWN